MGLSDDGVGGLEQFLGDAQASKKNWEDMIYANSRAEKAAAGGSWLGETWAGTKAGLKLFAINAVSAPVEALAGGAYILGKEGPNLVYNSKIVYNALSTSEGQRRVQQIISDGAGDVLLDATTAVQDAYQKGELTELVLKKAGGFVGGGVIKGAGGIATRTIPGAVERNVLRTGAKATVPKALTKGTVPKGKPLEATAKRNVAAPAAKLSKTKKAAEPPCENCTATKKTNHKGVSKRKQKKAAEQEARLEKHPTLKELTKENPRARRAAAKIATRQNWASGRKLKPKQAKRFQASLARDMRTFTRRMDKSVAPNTASLFSGFFKDLNVPGRVISAETVARHLGGVGLNTIFQSPVGKALVELEKMDFKFLGKTLTLGQVLGRERLTGIWEIASNGFAKQAEGVVTTIKGAVQLAGNIYDRIEVPALAGNLKAIERILGAEQLTDVLKSLTGVVPHSYLPKALLEQLMKRSPSGWLGPVGGFALDTALGEFIQRGVDAELRGDSK